MNDINHRIDLLQQEISNIKKEIVILKSSVFISGSISKPTLRQITECVCDVTGVPYAKIHSNRQDRQVMIPRQIISCIARWNFYYTYISIGKYLGKHYATIMYSTRTMKGLIKTDKLIAKLYKECLKCIKEL